MVQHHQVGDTRQNQPRPPGRGMSRKGSQDPGGEHAPRSRDRSHEVRTGETRDEGEVSQEEGSCESPVDVAQPEDLAEVVIVSVRDMLVALGDVGLLPGDTLAGCESQIAEERDGGDQRA